MKKIISTLLFAFVLPLCGCSGSKITAAKLTAEGAKRVNAYAERHKTSRQLKQKYPWLNPLNADDAVEDVKEGDAVTENMTFEIYPEEKDSLKSMFIVGTTNGEDLTSSKGKKLVEIKSPIKEDQLPNYYLNGDIRQESELEFGKTVHYTVHYEFVKKGTTAETGYFCQPTFELLLTDNEAPHTSHISEFGLILSYTLSAEDIEREIKSYVASQFETLDPKLVMSVSLKETVDELASIRENAIAAAKASATHTFPSTVLSFKVSASNNEETEEIPLTLMFKDDVLPRLKKNGSYVNSISLNGGTGITLCPKTVFANGCKELAIAAGYTLDDEIEGSNTNFKFQLNNSGAASLTVLNESGVEDTLVDNNTKISGYSLKTDKNDYHYFLNGELAYAFDEDEHVIVCAKNKYSVESNPSKVYEIKDLVINAGTAFETIVSPYKITRLFKWSGNPNIYNRIEVKIIILNSANRIRIDGGDEILSEYFYFNKLPYSLSNTISNLGYDSTFQMYFQDTESNYNTAVSNGELAEDWAGYIKTQNRHFNYSLQDFKNLSAISQYFD